MEEKKVTHNNENYISVMSLHIQTVIHRIMYHLDVVVMQKQVNGLLWEAQKKLDQRVPKRRTRLHQ